MGFGDGVGITVEVGEAVEAGLVGARDGCVAVSVREGSTVGRLWEAHAVQTISIERKIRDFIFAPI